MKKVISIVIVLILVVSTWMMIAGCKDSHVHELQHFGAKSPTCAEVGNIEYWYCSGCDKYFMDDAGVKEILKEEAIISATDEHVWGDWVIDGNASCTTGGKRYRKCTVCNYIVMEDFSAGNHKLEYIQGVPSTCTEDGSMEHWHCKFCGRNYLDEQGNIELETIEVEKLGHIAEYIEAQAATCGKDGNESYWRCTQCNESFCDEQCTKAVALQDLIIPKTDEHILSEEFIMIKEPTRTELGLKVKKCLNCSFELTKDVKTIDYDYTEGLNYVLNEEKTGYIVFHDKLDKNLTRPIIKDSTIAPHAVYNGLPVIEIDTITESQDDILNIQKIIIPETIKIMSKYYEDLVYLSSFDVVESNPYFSSHDGILFNHDQTELVYFPSAKIVYEYEVPDTVKKIGDGAFKYAKITILNCNEGLEEIGNSIISGNQDIEVINLPTTLKLIGEGAFNSSILKKINGLPSSIEYVGSNALTYGAENCENLTIYGGGVYLGNEDNPYLILTGSRWLNSEIIVHPDTKIISSGVGSSSGTDYEFIIPDGVITSGSLFGGDSVDKIYIGKNVKFTSENPFASVIGLKEITVSSDNPYYTAVDGVLYSKDMKTLLCYPSGRTATSYIINENCERIADYAFKFNAFNGFLEEIIMPDCVKEIGIYAFDSQNALKTIRLSNEIISIGEGAFNSCSQLNEIVIPDRTYGEITIGDKAFNWCTGLINVNLSSVVTSIGSSAFYNCSSLRTITIPSSVTNIGRMAFRGCTSLSDINILEGATIIDEYAFWGCKNLRSVIIPDSVITIGNSTFGNCKSLKSVTIPKGVTSLHASIFDGCDSLEEVHINDIEAWCAIDFKSERANPLYYGAKLYFEGKLLTDIELHQEVTSISDYAFYNCTSLRSIIMPDSLTSIGVKAFYNCSALTNLNIPSRVMSIGYSAFYNCNSLENIQVEEENKAYYSKGNCLIETSTKTLLLGCNNSIILDEMDLTCIEDYAFVNCYLLASINIPESVTRIGYAAFQNCNSLKSVIFTDNGQQVYLDAYAFRYCSSLTYIVIPANTIRENSVFKGCNDFIEIENGVSYADKYVVGCDTSISKVHLRNDTISIEWGAFSDCSLLTEVILPEDIASIGSGAFSGCSSLKNIMIPNSVTNIGSRTFYNCSSLESITVPEGVTSIGSEAFSGCSSLESITIPEGVTSIGSEAFSGCRSLASIKIPDSVTSIGSAVFTGCSAKIVWGNNPQISVIGKMFYGYEGEVIIPNNVEIGDWAFNECTSLKSIIIPEGVTSIGDYAFWGCSSLISITIPSSVTSIGRMAFDKCTSLSSITISEGVISIGDFAFESCSSLKSINIPKGVKCIGEKAFSNCGSLTRIFIHEGVESIGEEAFYYCENLSEVYLPSSLKSIGESAFIGCDKLITITIPSNVSFIGKDAFLVRLRDPIKINFTGTKTQWQYIIKSGNLWDYSRGYQIVCADGVFNKYA